MPMIGYWAAPDRQRDAQARPAAVLAVVVRLGHEGDVRAAERRHRARRRPEVVLLGRGSGHDPSVSADSKLTIDRSACASSSRDAGAERGRGVRREAVRERAADGEVDVAGEREASPACRRRPSPVERLGSTRRGSRVRGPDVRRRRCSARRPGSPATQPRRGRPPAPGRAIGSGAPVATPRGGRVGVAGWRARCAAAAGASRGGASSGVALAGTQGRYPLFAACGGPRALGRLAALAGPQRGVVELVRGADPHQDVTVEGTGRPRCPDGRPCRQPRSRRACSLATT